MARAPLPSLLPALLACALLAGCSSMRVGIDHDEDYAFPRAGRFAWTEGVPAESELHQQRIVEAVEEALRDHGFRPAGEGAPDLLVSTEVSTHRELRSTGSSVGFGIGRRTSWGGLGVGTSAGDRLYEETVGTLVITLADGPTGHTVWRASAEDVLTEDPEATAERIREAVERAFRDFPPE